MNIQVIIECGRAFFIGLFFPFAAVILDLEFKNISASSIFNLYLNNPSHFLVLSIPFILSIFSYFNYLSKKKQISFFKNKNSELDLKIKKSIEFAKKIGEGDFSSQNDAFDTNDELFVAFEKMKLNFLKNHEKELQQAWIAEGKNIISDVLRSHTKIELLAYEVLVTLIKYTKFIQGAFFYYDENTKTLTNIASYAYGRKKYLTQEFKYGKGLVGQVAYEKQSIYLKEIPKGYITITSGLLGNKKPSSLFIVPLISNEKLQGVIELACIENEISKDKRNLVEELSEIIARTIDNLKVSAQTEKLLRESQQMTLELKENEELLFKNAEEMKVAKNKVEEVNATLELKVKEIEHTHKRLHSLLVNASEVISIFDQNAIVTYESPSVKNILGYNPEEIIGQNAFSRLHESATNKLKDAFDELLTNPDNTVTIEFKYKRKDDQIIWLESTGKNLLNDPAVKGIIFNTRDITQRKIAEKEQRRRGQMQALSENSPDMIIRLSPEGIFYYANPVVEKYTYIAPSKILQKSIAESSLDNDYKDLFYGILDKVKERKTKFNMEHVFDSIFDKIIMSINVIPESSEEKEIETVLIVAHDITEQKKAENEIRDKNKSITESINYAKRIQTSIIPTIQQIKRYLPDSFVFYKPKDIISGDFPWFFTYNDSIFIAAVDCTGHGVPGALLSFIGYFLLNSISDHSVELDTGEILDKLHEKVKLTLKQEQDKPGSHDGMDIALCKIKLQTNELQYSGAHRPLYLVRNKEIVELKGDRKPIGGIYTTKKGNQNFTTHKVDINKNDRIFFFTDGFTDQFNVAQTKKYSPLRLQKNILDTVDRDIKELDDFFSQELYAWKENSKQTDDILLIGIEF